jgi:ATP-dependent DNA ligase
MYIEEGDMRNLSELKAECAKNNLTVKRSGKREAKSDYESALRDFYWKRDFPVQMMPPQLHPMLARNIKDVEASMASYMWDSPRWIAQRKIDGCRLLMHMGETQNTVTARRISDKTYRYSENTEQLPHLSKLVVPGFQGTVIDGEVVSPTASVNTGKCVTLNGLQATVALLALNPRDSVRVQREQDCQLEFKVFDILQYAGMDITGKSLEYRMQHLVRVVTEIYKLYPEAKIEIVSTLQGGADLKKSFYEEVVREGGEGIMLKDLNAPYEASSSRTKAMYKVKRFEEVDGFVTSFQPGDQGSGWEKVIGGLEVSAYDELSKQLHAVAWVTNLSFEQRVDATVCSSCGKPMKVDWENQAGKRVITQVSCQDCGEQPPALNKDWFNRVLVVRGQELTARVLRLKHAAIVSDRNDKAPEDCTIPLAKWRAKFMSKGEETGVVL